MDKNNIYDLSQAELSEWAVVQGFKPYMATQLTEWLYDKRVSSFDEMTNLAKGARAQLEAAFSFSTLEEVQRHASTDGSIKFGFRLNDGQVIESVLMPQRDRVTLCVSSQVGCAMGCRFCKTAEMKLKRHLSQAEILGQVLAAIRFMESEEALALRLQQESHCRRVSNIVFMGMGEPLHNLGPVTEAIRILLAQKAFNFSRKKITVSTAGLAPQIVSFGHEVPVKLAVSLNATNDALRTEIMPINRRHDLEELMQACRDYAQIRKQVVTFEYVLLRDINDTLAHAAELMRMIARTPCKLNLIPFNEYPGSPYQRPETERVMAFYQYLADRGLQVNIRYSKGLDVLAACGQLAVNEV